MKYTFFEYPEKTWPHDQSYAGACPQCGKIFHGPKRSPSCWECASEETQRWWHERNNPL